MSESITGTVSRVYFTSPTFSAGVLDSDDGLAVKYSGKFHSAVGDALNLTGNWTTHPKFGRQFSATGLSYDFPDTAEGLIRYLAKSPVFKGIGEAIATRLVTYAQSAERLDDLIRNHAEELHCALRIPEATLQSLRAGWIAHAAENKVRCYLSAFELTPCQMDTLIERFGEAVVGILRDDPYVLIHYVQGYGFKRVDEIARKMGVAKSHPGRIRAGLLHTVSDEIKDGHTWIDGNDLLRKANDLLLLDELDSLEQIKRAGKELAQAGELVCEGVAVTLPDIRDAEKVVSDAFLQARNFPLTEDAQPTAIPENLNEGQRQAYLNALSSRISVISGGAGTGKTFVVGKLASAWMERGVKVCLCAPTGKAAKRIEEVLRVKHGIDGVEAMTLHRVLGYDGRNYNTEMVDADVLLLDEFSMTDILLCAELFRRVDLSKSQVVLVGDHNQLPPVGPGNILRDIMAHNLVPNTVLTTVVRNAGPIERAAQQILSGIMPSANKAEPQWIVVDSFKEAPEIRNYLRDLVLDQIPRHMGYDPVRDVQIITPVHKGPLGTQAVNKMMQFLIHGEVNGRFAVGDKVIHTVNDYNLGIMNGHQGTVAQIEPEGITVNFDGEGKKLIEPEKLCGLQLAYALTAHKGQGSEFPCVVVLCHKSHFFVDRNWLYTAVTRAAKNVIVLGDRWGLRSAAMKNDVKTRRTLLPLWAGKADRA